MQLPHFNSKSWDNFAEPISLWVQQASESSDCWNLEEESWWSIISSVRGESVIPWRIVLCWGGFEVRFGQLWFVDSLGEWWKYCAQRFLITLSWSEINEIGWILSKYVARKTWKDQEADDFCSDRKLPSCQVQEWTPLLKYLHQQCP